jgi:hypothetical protein
MKEKSKTDEGVKERRLRERKRRKRFQGCPGELNHMRPRNLPRFSADWKELAISFDVF